MSQVVSLLNVSKVYSKFLSRSSVAAVSDVTFDIVEKEIVGLIGPNGSGKTTTMKMILGLTRPTSGDVTVFGKDTTNISIRRHIGFVPEESYLYGFLTAEETLDFYGRFFGIDRKTRLNKGKQLIDAVGLSFAGKRTVREYSKGMMRRLCIAQALINDPKLIIMDEPTSGLDPVSSREIRDLILKLKEEGKSILVSSHLLADIQDICDRIILMSNGKLQCVGRVDDLLVNKDFITVTCSGLTDQKIESLRGIVKTMGGEVKEIGYAKNTLEDIFFKLIKKQ